MLHFQGYLEVKEKKRISQLHTLPGFSDAHFDMRRGSLAEAIKYVTKDTTRVAGPWHLGEEWPRKKNGDLMGSGGNGGAKLGTACSKLMSGAKLSALAVDFPEVYCKHYKGLR